MFNHCWTGCSALTPPSKYLPGLMPSHIDRNTLIKSASNGCPRCMIIHEASKLFRNRNWSSAKLTHNPSCYPTLYHVSERILFAKRDDSIENTFHIPLSSGPESLMGDAYWTGSNESIAEAAEWLKTCLSSHKRCEQLTIPFLPDRILDIGNSSNVVTLCEPNGQCGQYACLSYCWGASKFLSTTSSNINLHKQGIPIQSLPQTFQDAIIVCRMLKIRYIWIDALCIVQDDVNDWMIQAQKMAAIYSNSHLSIASAKGDCADSGLFSYPPSPLAVRGLSARGVAHFPVVPEFNISVAPLPYSASDLNFQERLLPELPLQKRGWVFQETLLAPRILQFGPDELTWNCNDLRTCQCKMTGTFHGELSKYVFYDALHGKLDTYGARPSDLWRQIVMHYSKLALTKPSDKLPAIAGIADVMQQCRNDATYLCGLWSDSLVYDLVWFIEKPTEDSDETQSRSPSWSWASRNGQIFYSRHTSHTMAPTYCEILHSDVTVTEKAATGSIQMKCSKLELELDEDGPEISAEAITEAGRKLYTSVYPDSKRIVNGKHYIVRMTKPNYEEFLLVRLVDADKQTYRRVGLAKAKELHWGDVPALPWPPAEVITIL